MIGRRLTNQHKLQMPREGGIYQSQFPVSQFLVYFAS